MLITALVPIKKNSERISNKNFRSFNGRPLFQWVLETLQQCSLINEIIVNTNSDEVALFIDQNIPKGVLVKRPHELYGGLVTGNSLIAYDITQTSAGHFLQTHVTNPLLTLSTIEKAIRLYEASLPGFDSLFSTTNLLKRLYNAKGEPVNHSMGSMQRTQDMEPLYEENSNLFIFSRKSFMDAGNSRIGLRPQLFNMSKIESIDIDYEEDFLLAELIQRNIEHFKPLFGN